MLYKIILTLFLAVFPGLLLAGGNNQITHQDSLHLHTIDEVVITASRTSSLRINTPEAIRVVDNMAIREHQLRTAPEALLLTPGVFVQKTNHGGGSPFLRGLTGNQILLLIDGIRLSNATFRYGPNQYLNTIDLFSIEKMEVLRGNGSVQYGSDAIGGTIQVFSHDLITSEKSSWGATLLTRIATQGIEQSLHAGISYSSKKAVFRGGVSGRNFGDIIGGDTTGRQSPTGYHERDWDLKGKLMLSPSSELTMVYQSVNQTDVPVYHKVELENYAVYKMDPQRRKLAYVRLNQQIGAGIFKSAIFTACFQHSKEGRESRKNGSDILRYEEDKVRTLSISAEAITADNRGWSSSSGIEVYNDLVSSNRTDSDLSSDITVAKRGLYPDGATMTSLAAFSLQTIELPNWIFTAGVRFNTFIINVEDETVGHAKLTPSAVIGNLAILRKLSANSNLFVSANTGFRAPNIDDLGTLGIVDFRYETPNFDLKPEHSFQYQAGYKYQSPGIRGEIYIYRNDLYNLIVRNTIPGDTLEGYPVYQKKNSERAYIHGIETAWELDINKSWKVNGSVTYTYGQNITKNEPLRRIPPLFGRLGVEYSKKGWWIGLEWLAAAEQDRLAAGDKSDNRIPSGGTPGWNIFNVNAGYEMRYFKFDLGLQNLLNKDYRYHGSGVNGYGRFALFSITINI